MYFASTHYIKLKIKNNLLFTPEYAIISPMQIVIKILPYAQIILSVILVIAILLQQSSAGIGGALGGGEGGSFHHTRRGLEKFLFILSIVCGILFAVFAFLSIVIKSNI